MCIMISIEALAEQSNQYLYPGHGDGYYQSVLLNGYEDGCVVLPFQHKNHVLMEVQVQLSQLEIDQAMVHVASLQPFDYLAAKVEEEEDELTEALEEYRSAIGRHAQNEAWSHVMSEAADVVNTWTARCCFDGRSEEKWAQEFWAAVHSVAVRIARDTVWADRGGARLKVGGSVDWMAQRLLADVKPLALAVGLSAQAKSAEARARPHGGARHE